jgi:hypothetical protein
MNWLKTFGLAVVKAAEIVTGIVPLVAGALPANAANATATVASDFSKVANVIQTVEVGFAAISGADKSGSQKLQAATPLVKQVVLDWLQSGTLGSKKVKDQAGFDNACTELTSGFADLLNSLGD